MLTPTVQPEYGALSIGMDVDERRASCPDIPAALLRAHGDADLPIAAANPMASRLLGYGSTLEMLNLTPREIYADPGFHERLFAELMILGKATATSECQMIRKDGSRFWASVQAQASRTGDWGNREFVIALVNVTDRKDSEAALHASEERFRSLFRNASEGILIAESLEAKLQCGNPRICEMLGYSPEELTNLAISDIHPPDEMPVVVEHISRRSRGEMTVAKDIRVRRKDRSVFYADIHGSSLILNGRPHLVSFFHDVSERKQTEIDARDYQQRLRSLALELSLAEEQIRRDVSVQLHDEVSQVLSLAQMRLSLGKQSTTQNGFEQVSNEVNHLLRRATRSMRSLTFQLSNPALYDLGFCAGTDWLADDIKQMYGLNVNVTTVQNPEGMDLRIRVVLFQCLRELLVNVAKHAGVDEASVAINCDNQTVRLTVSDRGAGIDSQALKGKSESGGFGLFSIRARLESLGGRMEVRSALGEGASITLVAPLSCKQTKEVAQ